MVANDVVQVLSKRHRSSPLLLHGFSVGIYAWGECLVNIAQNSQNPDISSIPERVVGHIWDSPTDVQCLPIGVSKAATDNHMLQKIIHSYLE